MKWSLAIQKGAATLLPEDAANCSACRVFPAEHELAARIIEGRQEMVEERGPDHAIDLLHPKAL
jgi:hypothetical protein